MLVKFSFKNFKTFREEAELTLVAGSDTTRQTDNVIYDLPFNLRLLKSAVVYGANASGKSKMMEAMGFMRRFVLNSSRETQKGDRIGVEPFLLSTETLDKPSLFEIIFIYQNTMYRYGFEADIHHIGTEWLYFRPKTKEIELFYREGQEFDVHARLFPKGVSLSKNKMIRDNALMLSVAAQFNDKIAGKVVEWFNGFRVISALEPEGYKGYSVNSLENEDKRKKILKFIQMADLGIDDIRLNRIDFEKLPKDLTEEVRKQIQKEILSDARLVAVETKHKVYDEYLAVKGMATFQIERDESSGTDQFFALAGPIIDVLEKGWVLAVDELDAKMHPNLVAKIAGIFNSSVSNPNNAQMIFNTHDTNLLSSDCFRRDQIWFTEKDRYGATKLFSLAEFKDVRKEINYENNYLRGKFGGVPVLNDFETLYETKPSKPLTDDKQESSRKD